MACGTQGDEVGICQPQFRIVFGVLYMVDNFRRSGAPLCPAVLAHISVPHHDPASFPPPRGGIVKAAQFVVHGFLPPPFLPRGIQGISSRPRVQRPRNIQFTVFVERRNPFKGQSVNIL